MDEGDSKKRIMITLALKDKKILMLLGPRYQDEEAKVPLGFLRKSALITLFRYCCNEQG